MSPLRRRKRQREADLRLRARRAELAERERQAYERQRAEGQPVEPEYPEPGEPVEAQPRESEAVPQSETAPARRREFQPPRRAMPRPARKPKQRRPLRRRRLPRPDLGGIRSASASGARATVRQAQPGVRRLAAGLGRALTWPLIGILWLAGVVERAIATLLAVTSSVGGRGLAAAERLATPERVMVLVIGGAAGCLVVSQFVAYRGVEVGTPDYSAVSTVAPPPQTDRIDAGAAHAYVLVPLAAIALLIAVVALLTGRWRLGRLVSLIGVIGIAISLAIDLPKGLDAGTAGTAFAGAKATLTDGFYAQLAASASLVLCGWLLGFNLRREAGPAPRRRPKRRRHLRPRRAPSVAGGGA
jgi:hypothetical protein